MVLTQAESQISSIFVVFLVCITESLASIGRRIYRIFNTTVIVYGVSKEARQM